MSSSQENGIMLYWWDTGVDESNTHDLGNPPKPKDKLYLGAVYTNITYKLQNQNSAYSNVLDCTELTMRVKVILSHTLAVKYR
jgi:hypothetical protein